MKKLHIAFYCSLIAWPKPSTGGVRQRALKLANGLVARGQTVDMLTQAPLGRVLDEPRVDARVGRVVLGKGLMAYLRLAAYARPIHVYESLRPSVALTEQKAHRLLKQGCAPGRTLMSA